MSESHRQLISQRDQTKTTQKERKTRCKNEQGGFFVQELTGGFRHLPFGDGCRRPGETFRYPPGRQRRLEWRADGWLQVGA